MKKWQLIRQLIKAKDSTPDERAELVNQIVDPDLGDDKLIVQLTEDEIVWLCKYVHWDGLERGYDDGIAVTT